MAGGGSLAERPVAAASRVGVGTGAVLGQGCFGTVSSMTYNGAPVAVKELSAMTLDTESLGMPRVGVRVCIRARRRSISRQSR